MKEILLNEQAVEWLKEHINNELDNDEGVLQPSYSETSKWIMRHILSKLENE